MKAAPFEYFAPVTLAEVHELLAPSSSIGDGGAKVLAGGQSLVPLMNFRLARPSRIVDINRVKELAYFRVMPDALELGALCRQADIEADATVDSCGALRDAIPLIGHVAVRRRGTVIGSLVHGDPLAEWAALAILLDGEITVSSARGSRTIPAREWFTGYLDTAIDGDEVAESARFRLSSSGEGSAFVELARRHGDFCLVSAAASVALDDAGCVRQARVIVSGLGPVPLLVKEVGEALQGARPTEEVLAEVSRQAWNIGKVPGDIHASGAYRRHVAPVFVHRAMSLATRRAQEAQR
jgi:carbon-monoxide dehydrogenase medium subunit